MSRSNNRDGIVNEWIEAIRRLRPEFSANWEDDGSAQPMAWASQNGVDRSVQAIALAEVLGIRIADDLNHLQPLPEFVSQVPISFARQHGVLGLISEDGEGVLALGDPSAWSKVDVVSRFLGRPLTPIVSSLDTINAAINRAYEQRTGQAQEVIEAFDKDQVLEELQGYAPREDLLDVGDRAPVIKLVNAILFEAVKLHASDVHFQPYEDRLVARMRIDGVLFDSLEIPKRLQEEAITRIKIIGRMDIAEKRLAQDGRSTVQVGERVIDLRIASLPTSFGERVVIRLLDKSARIYTLGELGMPEETLNRFRELIRLEHGLILVTGPTGSGKSTTLYGALHEVDSKDRNVVTLEDPIEYQLEGVSQTQINEKKGMTFSTGLRHVLRQDPDIIMIGEIRDQETAVMAIQSALTGHLVFSTLHTNDAASAVTRLLDLGIEPYLVASSLIASMAQRLVRKICSDCQQPVTITRPEFERLGIDSARIGDRVLQRGAGCVACRGTGYRGRIGLFELLMVDDLIRSEVQSRANASQIREAALRNGMPLLLDDGIEKILDGTTSMDEVVRVTMRATT